MPDRYIESHIRRIPLFANLPPGAFNTVAKAFELYRYSRGDIIFQQGNGTTGLIMLVDGLAVLVRTMPDGQRQNLGIIEPGHILNQEALFADGVETATLQAIENTDILFLSRRTMATLIANHSEIKRGLGLEKSSAHLMQPKQFRTQREDERVLLKTRRHAWSWLRWLPLPLMVGGLFMLGGLALPAIAAVFLVPGLLIPGLFILYLYIEWRNDSVIITDQRVVRVTRTIRTFTDVFNEVALHSVQAVEADLPPRDPMAILLNYGTVEIKTPGQAGNFRLSMMHDPDSIQDLILDARQMSQTRTVNREQQQMNADLNRWLNGEPAPKQQTPEEEGDPVERLRRRTSREGFWNGLRIRFKTPEGALVVRKHWFVWFWAVLIPALISGIGLVVLVASLITGFGIVGWATGFVIFVVGFVWFYLRDWDWRNDYMVIADTTLTLIHQRPLWLQSERDQVLMAQIDNVIAQTNGFWRQILQFGDIHLSLVGADQHKIFKNVPDPIMLQGEISGRQGRLKQRQAEEAERNQREIVGEYLRLYHDQMGGNQAAPAASTGTPRVPSVPSIQPAQPYNAPGRSAQPSAQQPPRQQPPSGQASPSGSGFYDMRRPPGIPQQQVPQTPSISPARPFDQPRPGRRVPPPPDEPENDQPPRMPPRMPPR